MSYTMTMDMSQKASAYLERRGPRYADGEAIGRCPSLQDSIVAATALSHGMTMVTRNVGDFQFDGLSVVNPFEEKEVAQ